MTAVLEPNLARGRAPESSDRDFGFMFAAVLAIIGGWPLLRAARCRQLHAAQERAEPGAQNRLQG
jgi:hypothetical protein